MPLLATLLMGFVPGIVLGQNWMMISVSMIIVDVVVIITVAALLTKKLTVANRLILQTVIFLGWIVQISLLELMYFTMLYEFSAFLFILYVPIILVPVLLGIKCAREIHKNTTYNPQNIAHSRFLLSGIFTGVAGMNFAAIFRNMEQSTAVVIVLICFTFVNSVLSVGLLSLQRLYFLIKLKHSGIALDSF